jgi:hypothetical protein
MRTHNTDSRHGRDGSLVEHQRPVSASLAATAKDLAAAASTEEGVGEVYDAGELARHRHRRTRSWWRLGFPRRTE